MVVSSKTVIALHNALPLSLTKSVVNGVLAKEKFYHFCRPALYNMEIIGFDISFDDPPPLLISFIVNL